MPKFRKRSTPFNSPTRLQWTSRKDYNMKQPDLKNEIKAEAARLGMDLIGFANVERWEEDGMIPSSFFPQTIWPWSKTVIVVAVQIFLPILATTPSILYTELYNTANRVLDDSAYRIAGLLNRLGYRAFSITRDGYSNVSILEKKPEASFSHVVAGKYAGLGTIGLNHTLITPQFGPRIRLASVVTDAGIAPDPLLEKELCINCHLCEKKCPVHAFTSKKDRPIADMNKYLCTTNIKSRAVGPCGICTLVCPVGEDIKKYGRHIVSQEGVAHVQDFGTIKAVENL